MSFELTRRRLFLALLAGSASVTAARVFSAQPHGGPQDPGAVIPAAALLEPKELVPTLASAQDRPLILQVGVHVLYAQAHIPGSEYIGAAGTAAGLEALRKRVATTPKARFIVLYCGCCPWENCPNIRPAFNQLHALGFTHVQALRLAENFGADWVDKGYPVASGG
jgi:hypothetical protein